MSQLPAFHGQSAPVVSRPDRMFLGMMKPGPADVEALVARWRRSVVREANGMESRRSKELHYMDYWPLELRDYRAYARDFRTLHREMKSGQITSVTDNAGLRGFLSLGWSPEFTPDYQGWIAYLKAFNEVIATDIENLRLPSAMAEAGRREHTLIVAPVGWGKSELLKTLAYHYAEHRGLAAVVVLDPHGDLVKQMARWPELVRDDRVILIDPGLQKGKTVGLDPLNGEGLDEDERSIVADFWADQFGALTKELSVQMERVARHCVHVLLAYPGATLRDLVTLLDAKSVASANGRQRALLRFAQRYPVRGIADFFNGDFQSSYYESTRIALKGRIDAILRLPFAEAMFCGRGSFDLERAIEERKFILVNLAAFGDRGGANVGRVFVAMLAAIARRRHTLPIDQRTPTHVFIDEVSTMVSEELLKSLKQLRKFGLYQTLAQQIAGDGFSKEYKQVLTGLTACKFIGSPDGDVGGLLSAKEGLPPLEHRQFWVKWPGVAGVGCLEVRPDLANDSHEVGDDEWRAYERQMIATYYRDASDWRAPDSEPEFEEEEGVAFTPAEARRKKAPYRIPSPEEDEAAERQARQPPERPKQVAAPIVQKPRGRSRRRPSTS